MSLFEKTWVRAAVSLLSFIVIIIIELTTRDQLFAWSLDVISKIPKDGGLELTCKFLKALGGYNFVALLITWYVAMFKRRH